MSRLHIKKGPVLPGREERDKVAWAIKGMFIIGVHRGWVWKTVSPPPKGTLHGLKTD